jgi:hypothetical protein
MSLWTERILSHFTADLTRLWVACDPDDVLLDEKLLTELRSRGFELMLYEDPFAFRAEYEERYRAAWDRGEAGASAVTGSASAQRRCECLAVGHRAPRARGPAQPCGALPQAGIQRGTASRAGAFCRAVSCPPDRIAVSARRERVQGLHSRARLPTDAAKCNISAFLGIRHKKVPQADFTSVRHCNYGFGTNQCQVFDALIIPCLKLRCRLKCGEQGLEGLCPGRVPQLL